MTTMKLCTAYRLICLLPILMLAGGCSSHRTLSSLPSEQQKCYDRDNEPWTMTVDTHAHFRPFNHDAMNMQKIIDWMRNSGVLAANVYGIGQTLPKGSLCRYFTRCPGVPVTPGIDNDQDNVEAFLALAPTDIKLTLSMSFADLSKPQSILPQIKRLEKMYPNTFKWMGEVNVVKQALFNNGHKAVTLEQIAQWQPFMAYLEANNIPIALHSDLGNDADIDKYTYLMDDILSRFPGNKIVWMHMGLSRELTNIDADRHIEMMSAYLDKHANLMLDISWRILWQQHFNTDDASLVAYSRFFNRYFDRILPGSDFVFSSRSRYSQYHQALKLTSQIHRYLDNHAFRHIALGQNYFNLLQLPYRAPLICPSSQ